MNCYDLDGSLISRALAELPVDWSLELSLAGGGYSLYVELLDEFDELVSDAVPSEDESLSECIARLLRELPVPEESDEE